MESCAFDSVMFCALEQSEAMCSASGTRRSHQNHKGKALPPPYDFGVIVQNCNFIFLVKFGIA